MKTAIGSPFHVPTGDDLISALKLMPDQATGKQVAAVKFLLNTVLPSVEPRVNQTGSWLKDRGTCKVLGDTWHIEMATCQAILIHYSNIDNLLYNSGRSASDTSEGSETDNPFEKLKPKKPQKK